jgi:ABC-type glycerol-3-phosphate transport system permease component
MEIEEAAEIGGCGIVKTFFSIIYPHRSDYSLAFAAFMFSIVPMLVFYMKKNAPPPSRGTFTALRFGCGFKGDKAGTAALEWPQAARACP